MSLFLVIAGSQVLATFTTAEAAYTYPLECYIDAEWHVQEIWVELR